jgi:hypothetical protein
MSAWHNAPDLQVLINEIKAEHPGVTVYTIGDEAHQEEPSDHNPDADGSVNAADIMIGAHFTATDAKQLFARLKKLLDSRMAYAIYNRQIVSTTVDPGEARPYTKSDPHTNHVHVSVKHTAEADTRPWHISEDDMPINLADIKTIANTDGVFKAPAGSKNADGSDNEYWSMASYLYYTYAAAVSARTYANQALAAVKALASPQTLVAAFVAALPDNTDPITQAEVTTAVEAAFAQAFTPKEIEA